MGFCKIYSKNWTFILLDDTSGIIHGDKSRLNYKYTYSTIKNDNNYDS